MCQVFQGNSISPCQLNRISKESSLALTVQKKWEMREMQRIWLRSDLLSSLPSLRIIHTFFSNVSLWIFSTIVKLLQNTKWKARNWLRLAGRRGYKGSVSESHPAAQGSSQVRNGETEKHDNISSVVSEHGLSVWALRKEGQCRVLCAVCCGYKCRSKLSAGDFLRLKIMV